ncbi:MAG: TIGR03986 family CRISPR-associated RAMP protein [Marinifilaceae bacterium]
MAHKYNNSKQNHNTNNSGSKSGSNQNNHPQYIKAPFNFVPLNREVFYPKWAKEVSHDIPFSDGECGEIILKLEAQTPIFVRNGHSKQEAESKLENYLSFSHYINPKGEKQYFIPGTTLKGLVRNVLEIMSFSELSQFEDNLFSLREMRRNYLNQMNNIHCGWLKKENNKYFLKDCGTPGRISLRDIDSHFGTKFMNFITNSKQLKEDKNRTALRKYQLLGNNNLVAKFERLPSRTFTNKGKERRDPRQFVTFNDEGEQGTIVFTGQPGVRNNYRNKGKLYEFVFMDGSQTYYPVEDSIIKKFKSVHKDSLDFIDEEGRNDQLENGLEIPVFFMKQENGKIDSIGLSYMYKLPYANSVGDLINYHQNIEVGKIDLAKTIFGFTSEKAKLKGRVQFGNARMAPFEKPEEERMVATLGSPKASYYPIYLEQRPTQNKNYITSYYNTYDGKSKVSGWKRYIVRDTIHSIKDPNDYKPDLDTMFIPLKKGVSFDSNIRIHNLRKAEIGALLSSLTFHNNEEHLYHTLGQGKSLGLGKIKIKIELKGLKHSKEEYMLAFENTMRNDKADWLTSPQLKELAAMAYQQSDSLNDLFKHMHMDTNREQNEFLQAKEFKEFLQRHTELSKEFNIKSVNESLEQKYSVLTHEQ